MPHNKDITLKDYNRRELSLRTSAVKEILPEFFRTEYPKLITLLDEYYHFENSDASPSKLVDELFVTRDITQTDLGLLSFIEDELLLGQNFFEGFQDKRAASKYSSVLFRSKGTKYSIQQFFRTFFGIDPDIIYTRKNIFNVGEDNIGPESQRFITDNKLFQKHAILIKSELTEDLWKDAYKLFVHPAGTFLGSEVQIVSSVVDRVTAPEVIIEPPPPFAVHSNASFGSLAFIDHTSLVDDVNTDSDGILSRIRPEITSMLRDSNALISLEAIINQYSSLREAQIASSPTFDDSDQVGTNGMDFSNNFPFETLDQERHVFYSADSDQYLLNLGHLG